MITPGPWTYHAPSGWINADQCCTRGPMHVADIRGWGHLTGHGHGAHGMKWDDAKVIQDANAKLIFAAHGMLADLKNIATQKTTEELIAEGGMAYEDADFEGGYDAIIHIARRAVEPLT